MSYIVWWHQFLLRNTIFVYASYNLYSLVLHVRYQDKLIYGLVLSSCLDCSSFGTWVDAARQFEDLFHMLVVSRPHSIWNFRPHSIWNFQAQHLCQRQLDDCTNCLIPERLRQLCITPKLWNSSFLQVQYVVVSSGLSFYAWSLNFYSYFSNGLRY